MFFSVIVTFYTKEILEKTALRLTKQLSTGEC